MLGRGRRRGPTAEQQWKAQGKVPIPQTDPSEAVRQKYLKPLSDVVGQLCVHSFAPSRINVVSVLRRVRRSDTFRHVEISEIPLGEQTLRGIEVGRVFGWEINDVVRPPAEQWRRGNGSSILFLQTGHFAYAGNYFPPPPGPDRRWYAQAEGLEHVAEATTVDQAAIHDYLTDTLRAWEHEQSQQGGGETASDAKTD